MKNKYLLNSDDPFTKQIKSLGITTWDALTEYIQALPYGRITDRNDLNLVLKEGKGTCSSKHGLLKTIADNNHIPGIHLYLAVFKMNAQSNPKLGNFFKAHGLTYYPEAHCYLRIDGILRDYTGKVLDSEREYFYEAEISAEQTGTYKMQYQKDILRKWIVEKHIPKTFDEILEIRNQCLNLLSSPSSKN